MSGHVSTKNVCDVTPMPKFKVPLVESANGLYCFKVVLLADFEGHPFFGKEIENPLPLPVAGADEFGNRKMHLRSKL